MANEYDITAEEGMAAPISDDEIRADLARVHAEEGVSRDCLLSISIVGDERIRELNAEWRGSDVATDVISLECERPDDPDLADGEPCELGDIVLAPAYIERQAEELGTTAAAATRLSSCMPCSIRWDMTISQTTRLRSWRPARTSFSRRSRATRTWAM